MASPLPSLYHMAASRSHLFLVPCPAPTGSGIHIVDEVHLAYRDLCPYPSPNPGRGPCHALVGAGRRADVYAVRGPVHLASYSIPAKEVAW